MRVLLIEDDSAAAQLIELMLKSESFTVYTTDLGEEGIDLGKIYDYDIILLDLNLPDMSGFEVLRSLRISKVKTPTLFLSGLGGIEDKVKGFGVGADDYMTKPFHREELVARIHAIVRRSKGRASFGAQGDDAYQGNVLEPPLWWNARAAHGNNRCVHVQATKEACKSLGWQKLHRNRVGSWLCVAAPRGRSDEDIRLTRRT
jgi:DNA-binding response OmpR family regulator